MSIRNNLPLHFQEKYQNERKDIFTVHLERNIFETILNISTMKTCYCHVGNFPFFIF